MLLGRDHARDGERLELLGLVVDALDLKPDHGELVGERLNGLVGVEMLLQPGQGEFHGREPRVLRLFCTTSALASLLPPPLWGRARGGALSATAVWRSPLMTRVPRVQRPQPDESARTSASCLR